MSDDKFFTWRGKPSTEMSKEELIDMCICLEKRRKIAAQQAIDNLDLFSQTDKARATIRNEEIKSPFTFTALLAFIAGFLLGISTN